jgi:iron complex transport system substrate-binding protein
MMVAWGAGGRRTAVAGILMSAALLLGACGGSNDNSTKEQATPAVTQQAAAAAVTATTTATAAATPQSQGRTFTDDTGKTFTVQTPPKKVAALSPSVVEIMYAVGAPPAARVSSATYPDAARSLPAVGSSYQPNMEQIAAQNPDFIIADVQLQPPPTLAELGKLGVPVFAIRVESVDDVPRTLRLVGNLMGKGDEGEKAAKQIDDKLQSIQAKLPPANERPSVFVMVGTADAFWAAKPQSFAGDVVAKLGAKNLVTEGPDTAQFPGFTTYSLEKLAALDPDVILVITAGPPNAPPTSQQLAGNSAWAGLRAVKSGRVKELPAATLLQGAGPRVTEVIDQMLPVLYPGRF